MKTLFYRPILGAIALLFVANAAAAQVTVMTRAPLIEIHGVKRTLTLAPGNFIIYASETLIVNRDGWTFDSSVISPLPTSGPFTANIVEGAAPTAFQALGQALAANHVGIQSGNCDIGDAGNYEIDLIWYSRLSRINEVKVGSAFKGVQCPDEVTNIFRALGAYAATLRPSG